MLDPAFFFLHGFTGSPQSFGAVQALLPGAVVHAPYLHGHGPTPPLDARSFSEEVERLSRLARAHSRSALHLVGYSLGGRLGLALTLREPQLFCSVTLIGAHPGLPDQHRASRRAEDLAWIELLEKEGLAAFLEQWEARPLFSRETGLAPERFRARRAERREHHAAALASALRILGLAEMPDLRPLLGEVGVPVVLMAGQHDEKFRDLAHDLAARLSRGRAVIAGGAGHNLLLEAPETVAEVLSRIVEQEIVEKEAT